MFMGVVLGPALKAEVPTGVIEFAPMDVNGGNLMDLLAAAGTPGGSRQNMRGPARGGREAELDNMLANVIGGMLGGGAPMRSSGRISAGPSPGFTEEIVMEAPGNTQVMTFGGGSPFPTKQDRRSSLPAEFVRDLFPPMFGGGPMIVEDLNSPGPMFGQADPLMMDIMQQLDRSFASEMLPAIQKASSRERDPASCRDDVARKCQGAKSHLHCLGINHDSISEACRKEVGQSVPFRCSEAIDRYCDVLQTGILDCLHDRLSDLSGGCRDSVLATKHVINKANTQKASLTDLSTGSTKVNTPLGASPSEKEAKLDAKLGLAQGKIAPPAAILAKSASAAPASVLPPALAGKALPMNADAPRISWVNWLLPSRINIFFLMALVAFGAYLSTFSHYAEVVRKRLSRGEMEGVKLLDTNLELPKPDSF